MQKCYTMQMPTQKKRINITIDDATYAAIERLADEREESISRTSLRLIEEALEYQEDRYFSKAADARLKKKQPPRLPRRGLGLTYRVEYLRTVVDDDIPALPKSAKRQIRRAIETKLTTYPFELGKPLRYSLRGARRLRVGDYRVIYRIEPRDVALVVKIGHRREVYEK